MHATCISLYILKILSRLFMILTLYMYIHIYYANAMKVVVYTTWFKENDKKSLYVFNISMF